MKYAIKTRKEGGLVAIGLASIVMMASLIGHYITSSSLTQNADLQRKINNRIKVVDHMSEMASRVAQLMQSNQLSVDEPTRQFLDGVLTKPKKDGGYDGRFADNGMDKNKIIFRVCLDGKKSDNLAKYLAGEETAECLEQDKVINTLSYEGTHDLNVGQKGSPEYESYYKFKISTQMVSYDGQEHNSDQFFLVKKANTSFGGNTICPFLDPELNKPGNIFTEDQYIQHRRAFMGWTKVGVGKTVPAGGGYNSLQWRYEMFKDVNCHPGQGCGYFIPTDEFTVRRTWMTYAGRGKWHMSLILNVPRDDPGRCFWMARFTRRPKEAINAGCFAEGTKIRMADRSFKKIEEVVAGDQVYNPITKDIVVVSRTTAGPEEAPLRKIIFRNGSSVTVSEDHVFKTDNGLKTAKNLDEKRDRIIDQNRRFKSFKVEKIDRGEGDLPIVYNLYVAPYSFDERDHFVEADGIVTGDLYLQEKLSGVDSSKINSSIDQVSLQKYLNDRLQMTAH